MRRMGAQTPRRATVIAIRWISTAGQALTIATAVLFFGVEVPVALCVVALVLGSIVNLALTASAANRLLSEREAAAALCADVVQTAVLLGLAGGLANPFAVFLIGPSVVAATVLTLTSALVVSGLAILSAGVLHVERMPLILADGSAFAPPPAIELGLLAAIIAALVFLPAYARRVSVEAFDMSAALAATQMALEQEQRVSAIGAMAAAVAHQLGTPLATIKVTAAELKRELRAHPDAAEDAALIVEQAARCREILRELSSIRAPDDAQIRTAPIMTVLQEAAEPHQERRAEILFRCCGRPAGPEDPPVRQPAIPRRPELIHGLRNLIQNAADFAASTVWVDVEVSSKVIQIDIGDDGAGFSDDILDRLGEPFATTRGRGADADGAYVGMGLGVFIAKTLLERTGATLRFRNARGAGKRPPPDDDAGAEEPSGAVVQVIWPADALLSQAEPSSVEPNQDAIDAVATQRAVDGGSG